jgi:hypothetical protein
VSTFRHKNPSATRHQLSDGTAMHCLFLIDIDICTEWESVVWFSNVIFADQSRNTFLDKCGRRFKKFLYTASFLKSIRTASTSSMILWTQYHSVQNNSLIQNTLQKLGRFNVRFRQNKTSDFHYCVNELIYPPSHTKHAYCKCACFSYCLPSYTSRLYHPVPH